MSLFKRLLVFYGAGFAGTFAWLFFVMSGASACATGAATCQIAIGMTGKFALIWPAYWGARLTGGPVMAESVPGDITLAVVLAIGATLIILRIQGDEPEPVDTGKEPLFKIAEPGRRNQSADAVSGTPSSGEADRPDGPES